MPIYSYRSSQEPGCERCKAGFDKLQKLNDAPLQRCPHCLGPVERVVTAARLVGSDRLAARNVAEHGFTRYEKREKGVYEKTAGEGPDLIGDGD